MVRHVLLLHATRVAMPPIQGAFQDLWPDANLTNLLDDSLSTDRSREPGEMSQAMIDRFVRFGSHGYDDSVDGILATCSAFGPAIDRLSEVLPVPVLKPNEAMFRAAIAQGQNIGMLATFGPAIESMTDEFDQFVRDAKRPTRLRTILVDGAMERLRAGDVETHNRLVAERARDLDDCDAIMLAQFSTASALDYVQSMTDVTVLAAPHSAVERMRELIDGDH